jgi:hypothetical protein
MTVSQPSNLCLVVYIRSKLKKDPGLDRRWRVYQIQRRVQKLLTELTGETGMFTLLRCGINNVADNIYGVAPINQVNSELAMFQLASVTRVR